MFLYCDHIPFIPPSTYASCHKMSRISQIDKSIRCPRPDLASPDDARPKRHDAVPNMYFCLSSDASHLAPRLPYALLSSFCCMMTTAPITCSSFVRCDGYIAPKLLDYDSAPTVDYGPSAFIHPLCPSSKGRKLTTSQSIPSLTPLPSIALHPTILQFRSFSSASASASLISPAPFAPG